eukprot:jgi/Chlat1/6270/Chrsp44S05862
MEALAALGLPPATVRFLLAFLSTIPVAYIHRAMPTPTTRHAWAAVSGAVLCTAAFGVNTLIHLLIPAILAYAAMIVLRKYCGIVVFIGSFAYLISCHIGYASGDMWMNNGIDVTGAMMILMLKLISCAYNYQDGCYLDATPMPLHEVQRKYALRKLPSILEYFGYLFCDGLVMSGPVFEISTYLAYTNREEVYSPKYERRMPSSVLPSLTRLAIAIVCAGIYLKLLPQVDHLKSNIYSELPLWRKLWFMYRLSFFTRFKYYFAWNVAAAAMVMSGLGYTGAAPPAYPWERALNVHIKGVELCVSGAQLPAVWNVSVSTWLRTYVYIRLSPVGSKPGYLPLLATQFISGIWHGVYPGYILYFVSTSFMIAASKVLYRYQQALPKDAKTARNAFSVFHWAFTSVVHTYLTMGFIILSFSGTIAAWRSVHFIGHAMLLLVILLGFVYSPRAPKETVKVQKIQ